MKQRDIVDDDRATWTVTRRAMTGQLNCARVPSAVECVPYEGQRATLEILGGPFLFLLLVACKPTIPEGTFACEVDAQCPPGMGCFDSYCWSQRPLSGDAAVEGDASVTDAGYDGDASVIIYDGGSGDSGRDSGSDGGAPDAGPTYTYTVVPGPAGPGGRMCNLDAIWVRDGVMAGLAASSAGSSDPIVGGQYITACLSIDLGGLTPLDGILISMRSSSEGVAVCGETCEVPSCSSEGGSLFFMTSLDGAMITTHTGGTPLGPDLIDHSWATTAGTVTRYIILCRGRQSRSGGMIEIDYVEPMLR